MPKLKDYPDSLRPYEAHGLDLSWRPGDEQALSACPWCGREGKFSIEAATGRWRCWVCGEGNDRGGGNALTFLRILHRRAFDSTSSADHEALAAEIGLLWPESLLRWGVARSPLTGEWLVPGFDPTNGSLMTLYRLGRRAGTGRDARGQMLWPTSGMGHWLHSPSPAPREPTDVWVCEGWKDGIVLWEALRCSRLADRGRLEFTGSEASSLVASSLVVATPACTVFDPAWCQVAAGRDVHLMLDSDHPRGRCDRCKIGWPRPAGEPCPGCGGEPDHESPPAGWAGAARICRLLCEARVRPNRITVLRWGPDGHDPTRKSGWDVRDELTAAGGSPAVIEEVNGHAEDCER